ncbi:hypothetical protein HDU77_002022 [Chytriomyces hyalinus]|nr:hypothetical protein HDU77_002022 [Chytriomyces hyalinus]
MVTKSKKATKAAPAVKKGVSPTKPDPPAATATPKGLFAPIPIPDPPEKDENYDEAVAAKLAEARTTTPASTSKPKKKKLHGAGLAGHVLVKQLLGTAPKASANPATSEIKLEELDEVVLKQRLAALDKDLATYKEKCTRYKNENEWYRDEIESCEKDTTDYIKYLISKKEEKQATIDFLQGGKRKDMELFAQKRREREAYNNVKLEELKKYIIELELKLESKQQEMMSLSDIISKRSKHEAEIVKIKQDMQDADRAHNDRVSALERSLLETRIKLQRDADLKIQQMENAAHEKATKYLAEHTAALELENTRLEGELRFCITNTQDLLKKKDLIEQENKALERDQAVREDLLRLRIQRVSEAQLREKKAALQKKDRVVSAKKEVFKKLGAKYPSLKRDGMLPTVSDDIHKPATADSSLSCATLSGKNKSRLGPNAAEKPVMKLVVVAGSGKAAVPNQKDTLTAEHENGSFASGLQWEISDEDDEEFL